MRRKALPPQFVSPSPRKIGNDFDYLQYTEFFQGTPDFAENLTEICQLGAKTSGYGIRGPCGNNRGMRGATPRPGTTTLDKLRVTPDNWKSGVEKLRFARKSPKMVFGLLNRIGTKKLWKLNS